MRQATRRTMAMKAMKPPRRAALAGVVLLAVTSGFAVAAAGNKTSQVTRCIPRNLVAGLHGAQTGLGNRGFILTLTNAGNAACELDGYPGIGLENATRKHLASRTLRTSTYFDRDPGRSAIVLSPGEAASADLAYGSAGTPARSAAATYLEITPPDTRQPLNVSIPDAPAHIFSGTVQVTALARHTPY